MSFSSIMFSTNFVRKMKQEKARRFAKGGPKPAAPPNYDNVKSSGYGLGTGQMRKNLRDPNKQQVQHRMERISTFF